MSIKLRYGAMHGVPDPLAVAQKICKDCSNPDLRESAALYCALHSVAKAFAGLGKLPTNDNNDNNDDDDELEKICELVLRRVTDPTVVSKLLNTPDIALRMHNVALTHQHDWEKSVALNRLTSRAFAELLRPQKVQDPPSSKCVTKKRRIY